MYHGGAARVREPLNRQKKNTSRPSHCQHHPKKHLKKSRLEQIVGGKLNAGFGDAFDDVNWKPAVETSDTLRVHNTRTRLGVGVVRTQVRKCVDVRVCLLDSGMLGGLRQTDDSGMHGCSKRTRLSAVHRAPAAHLSFQNLTRAVPHAIVKPLLAMQAVGLVASSSINKSQPTRQAVCTRG